MPFSAAVYNVLIASPSDVLEERAAITQALHDWNSLHSLSQKMILLPVMWETHSAPAMGDRPQEIINKQVVRNCDMLIGAFWTRLGSPTGVEDSGTVEEIRWFLSNKRPVMLYFSKAQADLDNVDAEQLAKLKSFKASIRDKGIQEEYKNVDDLRTKLSRQLTIVMREMNIAPVIDKRGVQAVKNSTRDEDGSARVVTKVRDEAGAKPVNDSVWLEDYTDKAFVVRGETVGYKEALKAAGGRWINTRDNTKGWMFSKRHLGEVARMLDIQPEIAVGGNPPTTSK